MLAHLFADKSLSQRESLQRVEVQGIPSLPLSNERRRRDESVILPLQKLGETQGGEVGILTGDDLNAGGKARRRQADRRDRRWQVECT